MVKRWGCDGERVGMWWLKAGGVVVRENEAV